MRKAVLALIALAGVASSLSAQAQQRHWYGLSILSGRCEPVFPPDEMVEALRDGYGIAPAFREVRLPNGDVGSMAITRHGVSVSWPTAVGCLAYSFDPALRERLRAEGQAATEEFKARNPVDHLPPRPVWYMVDPRRGDCSISHSPATEINTRRTEGYDPTTTDHVSRGELVGVTVSWGVLPSSQRTFWVGRDACNAALARQRGTVPDRYR